MKDAFFQAKERSGAELPAFLEALRSDDAALAEEVESLLEAHREATTFVDRPAFELLVDRDRSLPRQIGAYRILDLLGEGGMGVVYLALRDDQTFEKKVALKVLSRDLATPDLRARFHTERQILANLEHPGIARLLDGGTTSDGLPYLVVEYVEGRALDRYVAEEGLTLDERLELLIKLCEAVHSAHQRFIAHRDLKPANILVTVDGQTKLLDFGIAKLLDSSATMALTGTSDRLLTPPYASPEQVRGTVVTTATDVYSLGVLGFELLTGVHPFAEVAVNRHELSEAILERPTPRPSTSVGRQARVDGEAQRQADRRLVRVLRGDLDRILMKAMHKEQDRRYASAEALARDIERYRSGLPVSAQRDTLRYRAGKFVGRHRWAVGIATAVFTTFVALTGLLLAQRQEILQERDRAESVSGFLIRLFESADPSHARGAEVTAGELLEQARRDIERPGLSDETVADLMLTMGDAYAGLGLYEPADELLSEALAVRQRLYRAPHSEIAEPMASLGRVYIEEGKLAEAEAVLRAAVKQRTAEFGREHLLTAESLADLGALKQRQGALEEAEEFFRQSVAVLEEGENGEVLAQALHRYAALERERGDYTKAENLQRRALDHLRKARGEAPDPATAVFTTSLGTILRRAGDDEGAEVLYREALADQRALFPRGHPDIAVTLSHIASTATRLGRFDEADELLAETIDLRLRLLGDDHPLVANALNNRGNLAADRGDLDLAENLYRKALAIQEQALPENHRDLVATWSNLGLVLDGRKEHAVAEALHRRALNAYRELYGNDHVRVAVVRNNLAESLKGQGRNNEARDELEQAVEILRLRLGADHPSLASVLSNLAAARRRTGDSTGAMELFDEALAIVETRLGPDNLTTLRIASNRMSLVLALDPGSPEREKAEELHQRLTEELGADHSAVTELAKALVR